MSLLRIDVPWNASLTTGEHQVVFYFLIVATLAFFAGFARTWLTRNEVGPRYRSAVSARLGMLGVATLVYVLLAVTFQTSYDAGPEGWTPNSSTIDLFSARYMGWTVTVPLLTIELLAVCAVSGVLARRSRVIALAASIAMIFCGFLGGIVIDDGTNPVPFVFWAVISAVFWVITNVVLIRAVRMSRTQLTGEAHALLNRATIVLLAGWVVYPVVYFLPLFGAGGAMTTAIMVALTSADVTIKLLFSTRIHRVAKLRTAEDVRAGVDVHPESIWISSVKLSDAGLPREVYLADGAAIHERRRRPPTGSATASVDPGHFDENPL